MVQCDGRLRGVHGRVYREHRQRRRRVDQLARIVVDEDDRLGADAKRARDSIQCEGAVVP